MSLHKYIQYLTKERGTLEPIIKAGMMAVLLGAGIVVAQFNEPAVAPVGNNTDLIHTGSAKQAKSGNFWARAIATDNPGGKLCLNNDTNCKTSWTSNQNIGNCRLESSQVINPNYWPVDVRYVSSCDAMTTVASQNAGWVNTGSNYHTIIAGKNAIPPSVCVFMRLVCNGVTVVPAISTVVTTYPVPNFSKSTNQCSDLINNEIPFLKIANPATLPTGDAFGTDFSPVTPDGEYLAVTHTTTPFVTIYEHFGDTYTKLSNPGTLPAGIGRRASFSPNGDYLAVSHDVSPFITIYKRSGDTFTKLPNPASLPTGDTRGISFSPDSIYLAVVQTASPYINIYKRTAGTDTFVKLTNPSTLPAGASYGAAFSPNGLYLAIGHDTSPYITIYKQSGDTFTKLGNPAALPAGQGRGVAFSPDSTYLAIGTTAGTWISLYKRSGDVFTKLPDPTPGPTSSVDAVEFSPNGSYLVLSALYSPYFYIYERAGDVFTKTTNPATLPTFRTMQSSFSPDNLYLAVPQYQPPYLNIYKNISDGIDYPADLQCGSWYDNTESSVEQCSDGINNDPFEDEDIDYPADFDCTNASDDNETYEEPCPTC